MIMTTENIPDPLLHAARDAARLMGAGVAGIAGSKQYSYWSGLATYRAVLVSVMGYVIGAETGGRLTLREAVAVVYAKKPTRRALLVVVCDASRPPRPVSILRSSDILYALYASRGVSDGIVVERVRAKGAV